MIPLFVTLRVRNPRRHFRLWIPLFLVWILLLPLALLLLPLYVIACLVAGMNPLRTAAASWQVLSSLRGSHIEVNHDRSLVLIRIS